MNIFKFFQKRTLTLKEQKQLEKEENLKNMLMQYQHGEDFYIYSKKEPKDTMKKANWGEWEIDALAIITVYLKKYYKNKTFHDLTNVSRNKIIKIAHDLVFWDEINLHWVDSLLYVAYSKESYNIFHDVIVESYLNDKELLPDLTSYERPDDEEDD